MESARRCEIEEQGDLPTVTLFLGSLTKYSTQGRATIPLPSTNILLTGILYGANDGGGESV